jgi:hypothetical protein
MLTPHRHASISAALRAERGLPENLIRLCLGIEDPRDLLDDLEHALITAGAIEPVPAAQLTDAESARLDRLYHSNVEAWTLERAKTFTRPGSADTKLVAAANTLAIEDKPTIAQDIVVSAPGKVILFGEHAVVHGVVRDQEA